MSARGIEESQKQVTNEDSFVFPLGEKVEVGSLVFDIGGGAANVAVSLARQGLHAAYLGKLGPARYQSHKGELPMAIVWQLERALPGDLFSQFAVAVA